MATTTVHVPAFAGPGYTYEYTNLFGRTIIKVRSTIEVRIAAPSVSGDYPVVYWGHGHFSKPSAAGFSDPAAIADQGFIVIVPTHLDSLDHPDQGSLINDRFPVTDPDSTLYRVEDINYLYDERADLIAELNNATGGGYTGDFSTTTIAGHSHGAFVAQALTGIESTTPEFANLENPVFKIAVLVSPQGDQAKATYGLYNNGPFDNSWMDVNAPMISLVGTEDVYPGSSDISHRDRLDSFQLSPALDKYSILIAGADHEEMANGSDQAITMAVADAAATFLDAYANNSSSALSSLLDTETFVKNNSIVSEAYERAGLSQGGVAGGAGYVEGTSGDDDLEGLITNDSIFGFAGNDAILGGPGDDAIEGGLGADAMTGGFGYDVFVYASIAESGTTSQTRDKIMDFDDDGDDLIDLSAIDADATVPGDQTFVYIGSAAFSAPGQVRVVSAGSEVFVELSDDNDTAAEMVIEMPSTPIAVVNSADFVL